MSGGGFREREVDVARPPAPLLAKLFEDVHVPAAQPVVAPTPEPAQGLGPPDPTALLDWMDVAPAKAPPDVLGFGHSDASSSRPIQLNPNAPRKPLPRGGPGPQLPPDDLARVGDTMEAQRLLTSKELKSSDNANQALQILNDVPEEQRGKAFDQRRSHPPGQPDRESILIILMVGRVHVTVADEDHGNLEAIEEFEGGV